MADLSPKQKKRIAQFLRLLSSKGGERRNAYTALERFMQSESITWSDIGNELELEKRNADSEGKYTEIELQQFGQERLAEGVEKGIKIGVAQAQTSARSNGHMTLPEPVQMAEYCYQRPNQLKDDAQRKFIDETYTRLLRGTNLYRGPLGYLASIYIKLGGKI